MSIIKVLNVGQGDSLILLPPEECIFDNMTVFVDLGPGQVDITKYIKKTSYIHLFITHHDADHLSGIKFLADKMGDVQGIAMPFYQNEITLIAKCILNFKGMREARDCGEFISLLEDILENQIYIKRLAYKTTGPQLSFVYAGKRICDHITCLNPPIIMDTFNWLKETSIEELVEVLCELFEPSFAQSMEMYFRAKSKGNKYIDSHDIIGITIDEGIGDQEGINTVFSQKGSYVVDFLMRNLAIIRSFNSAPERETLRIIYEDFVKCTHDACMVLRVEYLGKTFLLTGDASKKVFHRLIQEGVDISANYLKMPHHGSIQNISVDILDKIHPEVAIISHNNRYFGKAIDSHPNMQTLSILNQKGIKVMLTNDVCKHGVTCMKKANHLGDRFVDIL